MTDHTRAVFAALVDDADRISGPNVAGDRAHHESRDRTQTRGRSVDIAGLLGDVTPFSIADKLTRGPEETTDPFSSPDPFVTSYPDYRARNAAAPGQVLGPHTNSSPLDPTSSPDIGL